MALLLDTIESSSIIDKSFTSNTSKISLQSESYLNPSILTNLSGSSDEDKKRNQQMLSSIIESPIRSNFNISTHSSDKDSEISIYVDRGENLNFLFEMIFTDSKEDNDPKSSNDIMETNFESLVDYGLEYTKMQKSNSAVFEHQAVKNINKIIRSKPITYLVQPLQKKLFEKFMIIGIERKDLELVQGRIFNTVYKFTPRILYSYPAVDINNINNDVIKKFSFPFGVRAGRMKNDSFSNLSDIIYTKKYEQMNSNCFVFTMKSPESYNFDVQLEEVIEKSNPNRLLYVICIKIKDFCQIQSEKISKQNLESWKIEKAFYIVSYYPCINFFIQFLIKMLNAIKLMRIAQIDNTNNLNNQNDYSKIDSEYIDEIVRKKFDDQIQKLINMPIPDFGKTQAIELNFEAFITETISLKIEEKKNSYLMEALWCSSFVFSYLSLKDLLFLFAAAILECRLVIMSKMPALSTGVLFVLYSLMKPFICQSHMLFNIPEKENEYLDAPGGLLFGINAGERYLKKNRLLEKYSCIYVCLDEKKVYADKVLISEIEIPKFDDLENKLAPYYYQFNNKKTHDIININPKSLGWKNREKIVNQTQEIFSKEAKAVSMKIMSIFENALQKNIIENLPKEKTFDTFGQIDYKSIAYQVLLKSKKNIEDTVFLTKFFNTQAFHYYIEQKYCM